MRRTDREITDPAFIEKIIHSCDCCRLGFQDGDGVYLLPLNFGYEKHNDRRTLYFHGAAEGKKIDLIRRRPQVGFEMDTGHGLIEGSAACGYTYRYQSIVGQGVVCLVDRPEEKRRGLEKIMEHYTQTRDWSFPDAALDEVAVFRLDITELSCKEHR